MGLFNPEKENPKYPENLDDILRVRVEKQVRDDFYKSLLDLKSVINNLIRKYPGFVPSDKFNNLSDTKEKSVMMLYLNAILDQAIPDSVIDMATLRAKDNLIDQLFPKVKLVDL